MNLNREEIEFLQHVLEDYKGERCESISKKLKQELLYINTHNIDKDSYTLSELLRIIKSTIALHMDKTYVNNSVYSLNSNIITGYTVNSIIKDCGFYESNVNRIIEPLGYKVDIKFSLLIKPFKVPIDSNLYDIEGNKIVGESLNHKVIINNRDIDAITNFFKDKEKENESK